MTQAIDIRLGSAIKEDVKLDSVQNWEPIHIQDVIRWTYLKIHPWCLTTLRRSSSRIQNQKHEHFIKLRLDSRSLCTHLDLWNAFEPWKSQQNKKLFLSSRKLEKLNKVRKISPRKILYTVPLEKNFIYYTHLFAYMSIRERKVTFSQLPKYFSSICFFLVTFFIFSQVKQVWKTHITKKKALCFIFSQNKLLFYTRRWESFFRWFEKW